MNDRDSDRWSRDFSVNLSLLVSAQCDSAQCGCDTTPWSSPASIRLAISNSLAAFRLDSAARQQACLDGPETERVTVRSLLPAPDFEGANLARATQHDLASASKSILRDAFKEAQNLKQRSESDACVDKLMNGTGISVTTQQGLCCEHQSTVLTYATADGKLSWSSQSLWHKDSLAIKQLAAVRRSERVVDLISTKTNCFGQPICVQLALESDSEAIELESMLCQLKESSEADELDATNVTTKS